MLAGLVLDANIDKVNSYASITGGGTSALANNNASGRVAVGGIVVCSKNQAAQVNGSDGYLMSSLAAVFIGRSIGGREKYNAIGTAIGALLITVLENGMTMSGVVYYILPAVKGAVLCLALVAAYATSKDD